MQRIPYRAAILFALVATTLVRAAEVHDDELDDDL